MSVEQVIVKNSNQKIKALAPRAAKAAETPDHGVKIVTKGAYYVIRDCAQITVEYLPIKLYGYYDDPLEDLKGKFKKKEIESFVMRSKKSMEAGQLCNLMLIDARKKVRVGPKEELEFPAEPDVDDVYGDYGSDSYTEDEEPEVEFDFDDASQIVDVLCKAFEAK